MKNVIIRAPLLSYSGYGTHARQIFKWLLTRSDFNVSTQILQWGNTSWMINPEMEDGFVSDVMSRSIQENSKSDISFQVQLPDEWDSSVAKFNVGVSAFVETDLCNPDWIQKVNQMDLVIVPTNHIRDTILRTGKPTTPVHVVPESYLEEIEENLNPLPLDLDTSFNFLIVGQFTGGTPRNDRKNLLNTMKWIFEEFSDDPDVGLIVKTNHGRGTKIDREITRQKISQVISEVRPGPYPRVHLIHGNLTNREVASLYNVESVKCLVSLTRGEGFGLPLLEASAAKIPVIATNWSGHLDFLNVGKFIPVNYKLVEIPEDRIDGRIFKKGFRWADADEIDFKKKIRKFRHNYDKPNQWAADLSDRLKSTFSQKAVCEKYDSLFDSAFKDKF
jgi:glycosyltransferase involved in cell wall biosynthesis